MIDQVAQNKRRALVLLVVLGLVVAVPVFLVVLVAGFGLIGSVLGVVAGAGAAYAAWAAADGAVLRRLGAAPADPAAHARLHNLVDGLCLANGLTKPTLHVIDDPAPNALAAGRDAQQAHLVVTSGLLEQLDRVELEGVLAHELSRIKSADTVPATVAVTTVGLLKPFPGLYAKALAFAVGPEGADAADASAVEMTRYPPGLIAALEKLRAAGTTTGVAQPALAHLWIDAQPPLEQRVDTLREL